MNYAIYKVIVIYSYMNIFLSMYKYIQISIDKNRCIYLEIN